VRKVLAFVLSIAAAIAAYVVARVFGIFMWGVEPDGLIGEVILNSMSGAGMAFACFFVPTKIQLEEAAAARVGLSAFVALGTIVVLLSVFALLGGSTYQGSRLLVVASALAMPLGYFGVGLYARHS
jgi:hypothetical protein